MAVKQPQDHLKKVSEFRWPVGDKEIVLPAFKQAATAGWLRKNRNKSDVDMTFLLLEQLLNDEELELLDQLNLGEFNEFSEKWQSDSGVAIPES